LRADALFAGRLGVIPDASIGPALTAMRTRPASVLREE